MLGTYLDRQRAENESHGGSRGIKSRHVCRADEPHAVKIRTPRIGAGELS